MEAASRLTSGRLPLKRGCEVNGCRDIRMTEDTSSHKDDDLGKHGSHLGKHHSKSPKPELGRAVTPVWQQTARPRRVVSAIP